ncbi:MAG: glycosyltransferase involved in cell wall biosynthesis [Arenicella sp.]|jgi:glycosyltransferase involved in cell wall biosynthesis
MRVLHLTSGSLSSGSGKGALRLHQGLLGIGVDSHLATTDRNYPKNIKNILSKGLLLRSLFNSANQLISEVRQIGHGIGRSELYSFAENPLSVYSTINFGEYDIVHLHWVNYALSVTETARLAEKHNVVWTMRDMWPLTGGCHYSLSCERFKHGCGKCRLITDSHTEDISAVQFRLKVSAFKKIRFVAISDWLLEQASLSKIINKDRLSRIYNSVDPDVFSKRPDKKGLTEKLKIKTNRKIVIVGAQNLRDEYKGPREVRKFLSLHADDYFFIFFGTNLNEIIQGIAGLKYLSLGFISEHRLAEAFNVSDVFLMLSVQEAFGKTVVESLYCGTPVVVMPGSAPFEIISIFGDAAGIVWDGKSNINNAICNLIDSSSAIPLNDIKEKFSLDRIAKEYETIYLECRR